MARINHRQVEAFRAVMLTGQMTSAAELLRITQPAVSRLVRDFERALGVALFERRANGVVPTPNATHLLAEVERSFVGLERIAEVGQAIRTQETGQVRIAALPTLATSILPRYLGRFLRDRPNVRVSIQPMPSHLVVEAVAAGQVDFGYVMGPPDRPGFEIEKLPASAVAIMAVNHRLAAKNVLTPEDFSGERFVTTSTGTLFHSRVLTALAGIERVSLVDTSWSETACLLVAEGAGISIVDPFAVSEFTARGLAVRPLRPRIDIGSMFLRQHQRPVTPLGRTISEGVAREIRALADPGPSD